MNKEEKDSIIRDIQARLGAPQWDMGSPVNESAKQIVNVRINYALECKRAKAADRKKEADVRSSSEATLKDAIKDLDVKRAQSAGLPLYCTDSDLFGFSDNDKVVVKALLEFPDCTDTQISVKTGSKRQAVTAIKQSHQFKILYNKLYDRLLPLEALDSIRNAMKQGDSKVSLRVAEHYKLISSEKLELQTGPKLIEDPAALKMLKELGNKLSQKQEDKEIKDVES